MSLTIAERQAGDVTILELTGRITLGEASQRFRDSVRQRLSEGTRNFLLNLAGVTYVDSSGLYELRSAFTDVAVKGGRVKLLGPTKRLLDQLRLTQLLMLYEVFDDEAEALHSFQLAVKYCRCPVCRAQSRPPRFGGRDWDIQFCPSCSCQFTLLPGDHSDSEALITGARIRTHEKEYVQLSVAAPFTVKIVGRLDLFVSTPLLKMWRAIPSPRRVLLDLSGVTEADSAGAEVLLDLLAARAPGDKVVASLEGLPAVLMQAFPSAPEVFTTQAAALHALGDVSDTPRWLSQVDVFSY